MLRHWCKGRVVAYSDTPRTKLAALLCFVQATDVNSWKLTGNRVHQAESFPLYTDTIPNLAVVVNHLPMHSHKQLNYVYACVARHKPTVSIVSLQGTRYTFLSSYFAPPALRSLSHLADFHSSLILSLFHYIVLICKIQKLSCVFCS